MFPKEAQLINEYVGVCEDDNIVQYIVNGLPMYSHTQDDLNAFCFITSNFIEQGLCRKVDIERLFNVSEDSVYRYHKKFKEQDEQCID
jgi:hypothetical protein